MMVTNDRSQTLLLAWWISIERQTRIMHVRPDNTLKVLEIRSKYSEIVWDVEPFTEANGLTVNEETRHGFIAC